MTFNDLTAEPTKAFIKGHNKRRAAIRAENVRRFIGVDGEGTTRDHPTKKDIVQKLAHDGDKFGYYEVAQPRKIHDYVLLSVGDKSIHHNGEPLSLDDILEFLWECNDPEAIFVGYYLGYDFTEWFKSLPTAVAYELLTEDGAASRASSNPRDPRPRPVSYGKWHIDILPMKRFRFKPRDADDYMYICDMGPFFQASFVKTLEKWRKSDSSVCTSKELYQITTGKAARSEAAFDQEMIEYNVLENLILARIAKKLNEAFTSLGIRLKKDQWFGPGQAAQEFLKQIGAPLSKDVQEWVPEQLLLWAQWSYYGGWSEIFCHGHVPGPSYQYDRVSAYPYEAAKLPCLRHGRWSFTKPRHGSTPSCGIALVECTLRQSNGTKSRIGTMPYRTESGQILRPRNVKGIYWWREVLAADKAGCIDEYKIHGMWEYEKKCDCEPFAPIRKLYRRRREVGKSTPLGIAIKLLINSIYGKLAQSVGNPQYANPIYASLITSGCRTEIWEAIATHPEKTRAVTMVATDAVFFRSKHPTLKLGENLGEWELTELWNLTLHMPGIWWDENVRETDEGTIKTRGFRAIDLVGSVAYLDQQWFRFRTEARNFQISRTRRATVAIKHVGHPIDKEYEWFKSGNWPEAIIPVKFGLISARLALHRGKWHQAGMILQTERRLQSYPMMKRDGKSLHVEDDEYGGICWTMPYKKGPQGLESTPYSKEFGMQLKKDLLEQDIWSDADTNDNEFYAFLNSKPENMMELVE